MKYIVATIVAVLLGISFHAGVKHGRGELVPAVEARLRAVAARVKSFLPAFLQKYIP